MQLTSEALHLLLSLLETSSRGGFCPLPPRAARLLRSTHLRPPQVLEWACAAARAMLAVMQAPGAAPALLGARRGLHARPAARLEQAR